MKRNALGLTCVFIIHGCVQDADRGDESREDPADLASSEEGLQLSRSGSSSYVVPGEGLFGGAYRQMVFCNNGTWAKQFNQKVEGSQGKGDDTTLNSIKLGCADAAGNFTEEIEGYPGLYGTYHAGGPATCNGFLNGARMKAEPYLGSPDDTSANGVQFTCTGGGFISLPNDGPYGTYRDWIMCPSGRAICGYAIKYEDSQGGGDDTAMNGLKIACCPL